MNTNNLSRYDLQIIADWIKPNSNVLDLGCGDGRLLKYLQNNKQVHGYGIELNSEKIASCIENGINVIQTNLDQGLGQFDADSFDYVVLSLTLQAMRRPDMLLQEMLRVGKQGIVTFPNFAHWRNRAQLSFLGHMPVSKQLPHKWYNTPNIHLCTIKDFGELCQQLDFTVQDSLAVNADGDQSWALKINPNLFGEIALCRFSKMEK